MPGSGCPSTGSSTSSRRVVEVFTPSAAAGPPAAIPRAERIHEEDVIPVMIEGRKYRHDPRGRYPAVADEEAIAGEVITAPDGSSEPPSLPQASSRTQNDDEPTETCLALRLCRAFPPRIARLRRPRPWPWTHPTPGSWPRRRSPRGRSRSSTPTTSGWPNADGTGARRLTSHPGEEPNPYFSPDGKHIAFTASYDGNVDVYVAPVEGGEPRRLTWHPGDDIVRGFTPDGKVLFASQRAVFSSRHSQFFTVGIEGGVPAGPAGPHRRQGGDLARREVPGVHAAGRTVPPVEELPGRHRLEDLGPQARRPLARRDPQARPRAATTPTPCGSARRSTSSPTATASSTSTRTTRRRRRSIATPSTATSRSATPRPARAR